MYCLHKIKTGETNLQTIQPPMYSGALTTRLNRIIIGPEELTPRTDLQLGQCQAASGTDCRSKHAATRENPTES